MTDLEVAFATAEDLARLRQEAIAETAEDCAGIAIQFSDAQSECKVSEYAAGNIENAVACTDKASAGYRIASKIRAKFAPAQEVKRG